MTRPHATQPGSAADPLTAAREALADYDMHGIDPDDRFIVADHLRAALDREAELTAERDELRLTLDNERGEGAPPSEGWAWDGSCWVRDLPDNRQLRVSLEADTDTPNWRCWEEEAEDYSGSFIANAPTARAAMIAADLAAGSKP